MTTTTIPTAGAADADAKPFTAAVFLFGEGEDSVKALGDALAQNGVLGAVTGALGNVARAGRDAVGGQVAAVAHGLLDLDLGGVVLQGWGKFADLVSAARRTLAAPGSSEVVEVASHTISSSQNPRVQMLVNEVPLANVEFELALDFTVKGLVATVRDGRLVTVNAGTCDVTGTLSAQNRQLAERSGHLDLPWLVRVGEAGFPLLGNRLGAALTSDAPDAGAAPDAQDVPDAPDVPPASAAGGGEAAPAAS